MQKENYTILYIEDEDGTRVNIVKSLRLKYNLVLEAKDGLEGYRLYKEYNVDLIITDLLMPNMDGMEFLKKIRQEGSEIPAIIMSAYSDQKKLSEATELNIVEYVIKPISRAKLKEVLILGLSNVKVK